MRVRQTLNTLALQQADRNGRPKRRFRDTRLGNNTAVIQDIQDGNVADAIKFWALDETDLTRRDVYRISQLQNVMKELLRRVSARCSASPVAMSMRRRLAPLRDATILERLGKKASLEELCAIKEEMDRNLILMCFMDACDEVGYAIPDWAYECKWD